MKRGEYTVIEIFDKKGNNIEDVLKSVFKSYVIKKINSQKDLKIIK